MNTSNKTQITKKQHVLPVKSISRFYDGVTGCIQLCILEQGKILPTEKATSHFLFAERAWDENIERAAQGIETAFQTMIEDFLAGGLWTAKNNEIATGFYTLIKSRCEAKFRSVPEGDAVNDTAGSANFSREEQNNLEAKGIFMPSDEASMSRVVKGLAIRLDTLTSIRNALSWGRITCDDCEFIVSDDFTRFNAIPINASTYLVADEKDKLLTKEEAIDFNERIRLSARQSYFARDFSACRLP